MARRAVVIVLDAVGAGALPDAAAYGDEGSFTLRNVAEAVGGLELHNLEVLGLGGVVELPGCPPPLDPISISGRLAERSAGKDTTTGHWELMGILTPVAMPTYPDGFPAEIIDAFVEATGRSVLGNVAASGTEILDRLGDEHRASGRWIVYTSADSVFQVAAHEDVVPVDELYAACETARGILRGEHAVGRVIARPFTGASGAYRRTPGRHDYSLEPPRPNHLSVLRDRGVKVHGVGKIADIFAGRDVDSSAPTRSNAEGIAATLRLLDEVEDGLIFVNLVETDMIYGHRNDPVGFYGSLREFDDHLAEIVDRLRADDLLVLCSDHGCDPTTESTDHSREYALLIAHNPEITPTDVEAHWEGEFADVGATVVRWVTGADPPATLPGRSIPALAV